MSTAYLRHRTRELQRSVRLRDFIEQGSCVVALIYCSIMIFVATDHWLRTSMALLILGIGWGMFQWRRRVHHGSTCAATQTSVLFYMRELEHKRDLHRTLWRWYLLPMSPGAVALLTWTLFINPNTSETPIPRIVTGLVLVWVAGTLIYERYKAAQYQREIDALTGVDPEA